MTPKPSDFGHNCTMRSIVVSHDDRAPPAFVASDIRMRFLRCTRIGHLGKHQSDLEGAAPTRLACQADLSSHYLDEHLGDRGAKPGPRHCRAVGLVTALERLEDPDLILRRNA